MSRNHLALNFARWSRARRQALRRDQYRCRSCGRPGRLEVHHETPLSSGGAPFDLDNLKSLCRSCHIVLSAKANRRV